VTFTDSTVDSMSMGAVPYELNCNALKCEINGMERAGTIDSINDSEMVTTFSGDTITLERMPYPGRSSRSEQDRAGVRSLLLHLSASANVSSTGK
jgi:hypothetical protein